MFGSPTIAQLEDPNFKPGLVGMKRVDDEGRSGTPPYGPRRTAAAGLWSTTNCGRATGDLARPCRLAAVPV